MPPCKYDHALFPVSSHAAHTAPLLTSVSLCTVCRLISEASAEFKFDKNNSPKKVKFRRRQLKGIPAPGSNALPSTFQWWKKNDDFPYVGSVLPVSSNVLTLMIKRQERQTTDR